VHAVKAAVAQRGDVEDILGDLDDVEEPEVIVDLLLIF
jgi:hypothetical protein